MKFVLPICLALIACSHEEVHQEPPPKVHCEAPPPEPAPVNPFEKVTPPPVVFHEPIVKSHWEEIGNGFKMNDNWTLFTWNDSANHNICYFYTNARTDGMSCVKQ